MNTQKNQRKNKSSFFFTDSHAKFNTKKNGLNSRYKRLK